MGERYMEACQGGDGVEDIGLVQASPAACCGPGPTVCWVPWCTHFVLGNVLGAVSYLGLLCASPSQPYCWLYPKALALQCTRPPSVPSSLYSEPSTAGPTVHLALSLALWLQ